MRDRKERDRQLRTADILNSAERMFALKGYDGATIQDIADDAQYAAGTVYLYFKDKESLYFSLIEEKIRSMRAGIRKKTAQSPDAREKLGTCIREILDYFEKNRDFFRIYATERSKLQWTIDRKMSRSPSLRHAELLKELVKISQEQGYIRRDLDAGQTADMLLSTLTTLIFDRLQGKRKDATPLADMSEHILDIFFNGVGTK